MEIDYSRIQWGSIKKSGSNLILVDVNHPRSIKIKDMDENLKNELLQVNKYIEHSINDYGPDDNLTILDIKERAIDNRGNLILFVESEHIRYTR